MPNCDNCGVTPAQYEFIGTEASYDDYGRFEWQSTTYLCAECAAEFNPEAVKQRRLDEEADAEAAYWHDVAGPLLGLEGEGNRG